MRSVRESTPKNENHCHRVSFWSTFATGTLKAKEWQAWVGSAEPRLG